MTGLRVYVAGPYAPAPVRWTAAAIAAADRLLAAGCAPWVPHLRAPWAAVSSHAPEVWAGLDAAWLAVADAVVRLPGESAGADASVAVARRLGIPVFGSVHDLLVSGLVGHRPAQEGQEGSQEPFRASGAP